MQGTRNGEVWFFAEWEWQHSHYKKMKGRNDMAEGNFLLDIVAALHHAKSQAQLNRDIKTLQKDLGKIELKAGIDPKSLDGIKNSLKTIRIQAAVDPAAIQNMRNQINALANQTITVSNINVNQNQASKAGQQMGEGINKGLSSSLTYIKQTIANVVKDFTSNSKLNSFDLSKMFNLNRAGIDASVMKKVQGFTKELNALSKEVLKTNSDSAWEGIVDKVGKLANILEKFGRGRDLEPFRESIQLLEQFQNKKIFVGSKSDVLSNTGMGIRELNNQLRNLGVTFTTVAQGSTKLDSIWSELFNISPGLQQFESYADQLNALVSHFSIAKEALYGEGGLRPLHGNEHNGVLINWMQKLEDASKKLTTLRGEQAEIEQQISSQSSDSASTVVRNESRKQQAYQQTAQVQRAAVERAVKELNSFDNFKINVMPQIKDNLSSGFYSDQVQQQVEAYNRLGLELPNVKARIDALANAEGELNSVMRSGNSTLEQQKMVYDKFQYSLKNAKASTSLASNMFMSQDAVDGLVARLQAFLQKNSAMTASAKAEINGWISKLQQTDTVYKSLGNNAVSAMKRISVEQRKIGRLGDSMFTSLKKGFSVLSYWTSSTFVMMQAVTKVRQAFNELKEVNTIMTEISKVSDLTKNELTALGDAAFETASKYGKTVSDYLAGVQEMSRAGFSGENAEAMAELSVLAQAAGDIDADLANDYLISSDAAYKYAGNIEKLNALLDGQNMVTNLNAVSLEELAKATRVAASQLANANIEENELTALLGTGIATTKEAGETVGRAVKAIIMNFQQVKGETGFDDEVIDGEQLKKVEKRCHGLGVELEYMQDGIAKLRNPIDVMRELAEVYNSLPDDSAEKAGLIADIGGKHRGNVLSSILSNWDKFDKMLGDYSKGAGSAMNEAMKSASNWEGSLNRLHNTWVNTVENAANSDAIIAIINGFDGLLGIVNKVTAALGSLGSIGLFTGLFAGLKNNSFLRAVQDSLDKTRTKLLLFNKDWGTYKADWQASSGIKGKIGSLFASQALSQSDINAIRSYNAQIDACATSQAAWNKTMLDASPAAQNLVASCNGAKVSEERLAVATKGSTLAMKAQAAVMKVLSIAGNMLIFTAIAKGISLAITAIDNWIHRVEKANEAMDSAVSEYESIKSGLESINSELEENQQKMDGLLAKEKLTYAEEGQLEELKAITQELLLQQDIEERKADRASREAAGKTVDAFKEQYGRYDMSKGRLEDGLRSAEVGQFYAPGGEDDIVGSIVAYAKAKETLADAQEEFDNAVKNGEDTEYLEDDLQDYIDLVDSYSMQLEGNIADLQEMRANLQDEYNKAIEKRDAGIEPLATSEQDFINTYEAISDAVKMIYEHTDQSRWNDMQLSGIFSTQGIEKTKEELIEMAKAAEITPETLEGYPKLNQAIQDSEIFLKDGQTAAQAFCNEINACVDAAGKIESKAETPQTVSFSEAWESLDNIEDDDSKMKGLKEELLKLAEAGELTAKAFKEAEGSDEFLEQIGESAEVATVKIMDILDAQGKLSAASGGLENLTKAYEEFKDEDIGFVTAETLESLPDVFKELEGFDLFSTIVGDPTQGAERIQQAFNDIVQEYLITQGTLSGLIGASDAEIQSYIANLKQMGITNAQELVNQVISVLSEENALINAAETEFFNAHIRYIRSKNEADLAYLNTAESNNGKLVAALGSAYSSDYQNWCSLLSKKAEQYNEFVRRLSDSEGNLMSGNWAQDQRNKRELGKYNESGKDADKAKDKLKTGAYINTGFGGSSFSPNIGGSGKKNGGGGGNGSSSKPTPEPFDFIKTLVSRIEAAIERLKSKAESTFLSLKTRAAAYNKAIAKVTEEINIQSQAYGAYMAKANSIGLEAAYAAQVRDGSINIDEVSDDGLKERIKNYQEWYEKALDCQDAIRELKNTQRELLQEKIEAYITKYDQIIARLESASTRIQNNLDIKEAWGLSASANDYKSLNKNLMKQMRNMMLQRKKLIELRATVKKGTEAWYEYNERIDSNSESIQELTKSMAENATAQAELAKAKADRRNEREDTEDEALDARLSTSSSASGKNRLINAKAKNADQRQNNLKVAYESSKKNRVKYGTGIQKAGQKGVSRRNKKLFQKAIKCVKDRKLIGVSILNSIADAMKNAKGNEYNALGRLLSYCNNYNAYKNAEEENRLAYEMYALTAQAEKKSMREEQLQNKLDSRQKVADRATTSMAETAYAKNRNSNIQVSLAEGNAKAYTEARKLASSDRKKAAKKASFYTGKQYKKATGKLKSRLKKVASAIKSGKKISSDGLKAVKEYCVKYLSGNLSYYYNCRAYNEAVENEISAKDAEAIAKADAYAAKLQSRMEKTENSVSKRDSENELYEATAKNEKTAYGKNKYVNMRISNVKKNLADYKDTYTQNNSSLKSARKKVDSTKGTDKASRKTISEIKKYTAKGAFIPQSLVKKAYGISNAFGLACENYNESLEARNASKETYELYQQTAKTEMESMAMEKLENIGKEYDNKIAGYEQRATELDNAISLTQAKGYQTGKAFYENLYANEESRNKELRKKREDMVKSLADSVATGKIEKYSDAWYEAVANIDDVTNAIDESSISLEEYVSQMRQLEWDNFEYLQGLINDTTQEMGFLIDELSRQDLTSDKTGSLTDEGRSVAMLHAMNYSVKKDQLEAYAEQVRKIDKELAKDPYNKTLIDQQREYQQAMQDTIKGIEDEKYAVIDLYKQGYEALVAKIRELISEYSGLLDAEKDAFDYNNTISDKTKEIANLRKQLAAYANDMSEETRAKAQTLRVSLEEAEKDLQETQYDKYISDTKEMLSDLGDDFEEAIQELISNLHLEFDKLVADINTNRGESVNTILNKMEEIGYAPTEELKSLLEGISKAETPGSNGEIPEITSAVNGMIGSIKDFCADMTGFADLIAKAASVIKAVADEIPDKKPDGGNENNGGAGNNGNNGNAGNNGTDNGSNAGDTGKPKGGKTEMYIEPPKTVSPVTIPDNVMIDESQLNKDTSLIDTSYLDKFKPIMEAPKKTDGTKKKPDAAMKKAEQKAYTLDYIKAHASAAKKKPASDLNKKIYDNFGKKVLSLKEAKELAENLGIKYDNAKSTGKLYKKLRSLGVKGFKVGSPYIPYDQLAFLGEGGNELHFDRDKGILREVGQGDMVFTADMTKNLWEIANADPSKIFGVNMTKSGSVQAQPMGGMGDVNVTFGDLTLPDVTNSEEFAGSVKQVMRKAICDDYRTQKCFSEAISSQMLGKGVGIARHWKN